MALNCVTTLPPEPNQDSPFAENEGQALMATVTTISPIKSTTAAPSVPSTRSVRRSVATAARRAWLEAIRCAPPPPCIALSGSRFGSVDRDPTRADDPFGGGVPARDPLDELQGRALWPALGHHPEVTHAAVLPGLGVAQVAGHALVSDRVDSGGVGEGHEPDRLLVACDVALLQAIGRLGRRARG